ncbi:U3 small nucleolar RNA-associated protein 4 homolog isoform X3 [Apostichopus japonicus]|uniref:U3 small nucleolar RNA-associated protein 4 homolog isoform X3 n=1 Tax=Stichopus japonicus TaxID=307972 RepID=UPI003AB2B994
MGEFKVHNGKFFEYMPSGIQCMSYSNHTLAVGRTDGSIDIWKVTEESWYHQKTLPGSEQRNVQCLAWVKGRLFSAGLQGNITEYDLVKLSPKVSHFYGHGFWCMSASHDKSRLAVGCEDGCVRLYKILEDKGVVYERGFQFQKEQIVSLAWHRSGEVIVTGSINNIRVWDVASGQVKQRITTQRLRRRQEVVVWCLTILQDFTIVSGDSQGLTQFWDARTGVSLQSFNSHRAGIFALCVSPNERSVYTAGADPRIVTFSLASTNDRNNREEWTKAWSSHHHFHDVKALSVVDDLLVSGGTDTILRSTALHRLGSDSNSQIIPKRRNDLPFPMKPLVQTAPEANLILCQHQCSVELWRLGSIEKDVRDFADGASISIASGPSKLIEIRSKSGEQIICSALSTCGSWLAYSTVEKIRLYKVTLDPLVLHKVPLIPDSVLPSHQLKFTPDLSKLVSVTNQCSIQLVTLDDLHPILFHTFEPMERPISNMAIPSKGSVMAVTDESGLIKLLNFKDPSKEIQTALPRYKPIISMALNYSGSLLFVVYSDRSMNEFSLHQQTYSKMSPKLAKFCTLQWLGRKQSIVHVEYNQTNDSQLILMDNTSLVVLNKQKRPPDDYEPIYDVSAGSKRGREAPPMSKVKRGREAPPMSKVKRGREAPPMSNVKHGVAVGEKNKVQHGMAACEKYKPLLFAGFLSDPKTILVIERPIRSIYEKLPPAFQTKKFGT